MILSDSTLRLFIESGDLVIKPEPEDWQFQPASIELTLGHEFVEPYQHTRMVNDSGYTILPSECVLASTEQIIELPGNMVARVEGKSSWGRRFIMVHSTAGFVDPGFRGTLTLELVNLSRVPQFLPTGSPIAQLSFQCTDLPVSRPYGHPALDNHYQGQTGTTVSALPWV